MPPVIDEEELERIREGKPELKKRNWYTTPDRIERVDAAVKEFGFKSSNKLIDRAVDWYIDSLREVKEKKKGNGNKK